MAGEPAIAAKHEACGFESPTSMRHGAVSSVWQGIKRTHGTAQNAKAPVLIESLRTMVRNLQPRVIGVRDRALLLLGFAGAFRRSELVALDCADVQFTSDGFNLAGGALSDGVEEGRVIVIPRYSVVVQECEDSLAVLLKAVSIRHRNLSLEVSFTQCAQERFSRRFMLV